jgi:uncharacterized membrane protein
MAHQNQPAQAWALGGVLFAGTLMIIVGIWQFLIGLAAIINDDFFVVVQQYAYEVNLTGWGWLHLILGVIVVLAGLAIFTGAVWARAVGTLLAILVAINNFFFLPYYPLWSIVVIALAVFVIWALATAPRRELP